MPIQRGSDNFILVDLPRALEEHDELRAVTERVQEHGGCSVVIDLANVDVVGSPIFAKLLELRQSLHDHGHRLVICGAAPAIRGVFRVARLDEVFEFAEDRRAALASLQTVGQGHEHTREASPPNTANPGGTTADG